MSKRMKIVFTLSILLNVVFVGIGAGMMYRYCNDFPMGGGGRMSPEARSFVTTTYKNGRDQMKPLIDEVRERRKAVEATLTGDNFDRKSYDAAVDRLLETQGKIARTKADIMGKALNDLSPDDRKAFSQQIIDGLTPGRPKWKGHDEGRKGAPDRGQETGKPAQP